MNKEMSITAKLSDVLGHLPHTSWVGPEEMEITGISTDSREVKPGHLFIAVKGSHVDGHRYIAQAVEQGAAAVVCSQMPAQRTEGVAYIEWADTQAAPGLIANAYYGHPSWEGLRLVGVTGTNGKTTIATLLYRLTKAMGYRAGLISTVCNLIDGEQLPTDHTTPDPLTLNRLLAEMERRGCEYAFMEVSSHAVDQQRIAGLNFAGGIFTNLTRDHLDYHLTVENYLKAKKRFFDDLPAEAFALTNADDRNGGVMTQNTRARIATYSLQQAADFKARILESHLEGMLLRLDGREMAVDFVGRFNAYNLLAVYGAACLLGLDRDETARILTTLHPVDGRFEAIRSTRGFTAIVDYAHTPDALANVLESIQGVMQGRGHLITVCGAGGDRDKGKRPLMAAEAAKRSDRVILTSDNPRSEEPQAIIDDMLAGLDAGQRQQTLCIVDRREAIKTACALAQAGDVVLIAGKGHEDYQEIKGVKHHFDDREEVRKNI